MHGKLQRLTDQDVPLPVHSVTDLPLIWSSRLRIVRRLHQEVL